MSRAVPPEIRAIVDELTHKLKTETGVCHGCKETFTLGNLWPVAGSPYFVCGVCLEEGNRRLLQAIAEAMRR